MDTTYSNSSQQGATVLESSFVCIPLILLAALLLELTHSHHVRQIAQLALYEAARTGSVSGAQPQEIEQTFSIAILPLFVPAGRHGTSAKRREAQEQKVSNETGLSLWEIDTLNPDPFVFRDFSDPALSRKLGRPTLRNDYLTEQHQAHIKQGWQGGYGPLSGLTVFEANTLRLKLSLLYKPRTPGIAFILKKLSTGRTDRTGVAWQKGYLVTELVTEVVMQSHAQQWRATGQNQSHIIKPEIPRFVATPISQSLPSARPLPALASRNQSPESRLSDQDIKPDATAERAVANDAATVKDVTAVKAATTEDNTLCVGLLCCQ